MAETQRQAKRSRKTKETQVFVQLNLDEPAVPEIETGVGFFDHMLTALGTHGRFGLIVNAVGDLHTDQHHLVEDVGIVLGQVLADALGEERRIRRFAHAYAPLDESLARAVVDISGRPYLQYGVKISRPLVGSFDTDLVREFYQAFVSNALINLHLDLLHGDNAHHQIEAMFKATALALRDAVRLDRELTGIPSTKGTLTENAARTQEP